MVLHILEFEEFHSLEFSTKDGPKQHFSIFLISKSLYFLNVIKNPHKLLLYELHLSIFTVSKLKLRIFFNYKDTKAYIQLAVRLRTSSHVILPLYTSLYPEEEMGWGKSKLCLIYYYRNKFWPWRGLSGIQRLPNNILRAIVLKYFPPLE